MIENRFISVDKILRAHKYDQYEFFHIIGKKGWGKTTLSVKIMTQTYMALGYDETSAWQMAIDHLVFDKRDIINFLKTHTGKPEPVLCWDDARVFGSGMSYVIQPLETQELFGLMDTIRTSVTGFILTSPAVTGLLKFLRTEEGWLLKVGKDRQWNQRRARVYERVLLPSGTPRLYRKYEEEFHYRLPDWVYAKVKAKRLRYKKKIIDFIDTRIRYSDHNKEWKKMKETINEPE